MYILLLHTKQQIQVHASNANTVKHKKDKKKQKTTAVIAT